MFPKFMVLHESFFEDHIALITFETVVSIELVSLKRHLVAQSFLALITLGKIPCYYMSI